MSKLDKWALLCMFANWYITVKVSSFNLPQLCSPLLWRCEEGLRVQRNKSVCWHEWRQLYLWSRKSQVCLRGLLLMPLPEILLLFTACFGEFSREMTQMVVMTNSQMVSAKLTHSFIQVFWRLSELFMLLEKIKSWFPKKWSSHYSWVSIPRCTVLIKSKCEWVPWTMTYRHHVIAHSCSIGCLMRALHLFSIKYPVVSLSFLLWLLTGTLSLHHLFAPSFSTEDLAWELAPLIFILMNQLQSHIIAVDENLRAARWCSG